MSFRALYFRRSNQNVKIVLNVFELQNAVGKKGHSETKKETSKAR